MPRVRRECIHMLALEENQRVCPKCDHHFLITARERLAAFLDPGSFREEDTDLWPVDILKFKGPKSYAGSLKKYLGGDRGSPTRSSPAWARSREGPSRWP